MQHQVTWLESDHVGPLEWLSESFSEILLTYVNLLAVSLWGSLTCFWLLKIIWVEVILDALKVFFYWTVVDLQCFVSFGSTAKWFSAYIHTHILLHYSLLQDIDYSPLCFTVGPCWLSILYIIVCMHYSHTSNLSFLPFPLW